MIKCFASASRRVLRAMLVVVCAAAAAGFGGIRAQEAEQLPFSVIGKGGREAEPAVIESAPDAPLASWVTAAPYPIAIGRYGFAQVGQVFFVVSGVSNGTITNTVRSYSPVSNTWGDRAAIPVASEAPAAAHFGGKLYVADGDGGTNLMRIYDIAANTWSAGPARPGATSSFGAGAGAHNGKVYVIGGGSGTGGSTLTSIYDVVTNTWSTGPAAPAAYHLGGYAQSGRYLYLVGSITIDPNMNSAVTMRLDMETNTWSTGPAFTPQRADFGLAVAGSKLVALGGDANGGGYFNSSTDVSELDTAVWPGGAWTNSPNPLPSARQGNTAGFFSVARTGAEIWSVGGLRGPSSPFTWLAENLLRPTSPPPWFPLASAPAPVARYGFAQAGQHSYVISGLTTGSTITSAVLRYEAALDTWASRAAIPVGSQAPAAVYYEGKIYVADGGGGGNLMRIYSTVANTWTAGAARPGVGSSFGAAAGAYNGKVYVVGGGGTPTTVTSIYDIASNTWSTGPAAPAGFFMGGYAQIGRYLYLVGGYGGSPANSTTTMRLDMATDTWSTGPAFTPQRADFGLATSGNRLIAIGGDLSGGGFFEPSAQVDDLDVSHWPSGAWSTSAVPLPSARQGNRGGFFTTPATGGEIWSTGGIALGNVYLSDNLLRGQRRFTTCQDYQVSQSTGSIVPGTTDTGNHCDDCNTAVTLPFPVTVYNQTFTTIRVSSNGHAQFVSNNEAFANGFLPAAIFDVAIMPFWDDMRTDGAGGGIFTSVTGTAPNRAFNIEWRTTPFNGVGAANFQLRFFEGSSRFEVIYGNSSGSYSGTAGVQAGFGGLFTQQFGPASPLPASGTRLTYNIGCCPAINFTGSLGLNSPTYPGTSGIQPGRLNRFPPASTCSAPKTFPGLFDTAGRTYDAYTFFNSGPATCVTFRVTTPCTGSNFIFPVAYLGSFDPANPGANYLGDSGDSPNPSGTFSVNVPANSSVVLGIHEVTPGGGCQSYNVTVEGVGCGPLPQAVVSRKSHAGTPFDLPLPLTGAPGVECRLGGATNDYQLVLNFATPVTLLGTPQAEVISGTGTVGSSGASNGGVATVSDNVITLPLTNVTNAQALTVRLNAATNGGPVGDIVIPLKLLIGDTNGDSVVNSGDAIQTRSRAGQAASATTFRSDVNTDGFINSGDSIAIRARSGTSVSGAAEVERGTVETEAPAPQE
jgi:hypothetical protein